MDANTQVREASRALAGLESGNLPVADVYNVLDKLDPVLVFFIIRYLREMYPATNPQAMGVKQRLVELTGTYSDIVKKSREAEGDPIVEWFDDTYSIREFHGRHGDLLELIVDKLEG